MTKFFKATMPSKHFLSRALVSSALLALSTGYGAAGTALPVWTNELRAHDEPSDVIVGKLKSTTRALTDTWPNNVVGVDETLVTASVRDSDDRQLWPILPASIDDPDDAHAWPRLAGTIDDPDQAHAWPQQAGTIDNPDDAHAWPRLAGSVDDPDLAIPSWTRIASRVDDHELAYAPWPRLPSSVDDPQLALVETGTVDYNTQTASLKTSGDPRTGGFAVTQTFDYQLIKALEERVAQSAGKVSKRERKERAAIAEFYAERDFKPLWLLDGKLSPEARSLIAKLSRAEEDGLTAADYPTMMPTKGASVDLLAETELQLSASLVHYARDAQGGRVSPGAVHRSIKVRPVYPDTGSVMAELAASDDKVATLENYNPPHAAFQALKVELAHLRKAENEKEQPIIVPDGKTLAIGSEGERVVILRQRLNVPVLNGEDAAVFDETLKSAVRAFQTENRLIADGIVGRKTLNVLNRDVGNRIPDVIANMEAWRWMPREMGKFHIVANIPSFHVSVMKDGALIHRTRTVVGKNKHKTPVFSDKMEFVVVNPYWNVPYSIASKELLPKIQRNPGFVYNGNYEILRGRNVINPASVNWDENSFRRYRIRQRPGGQNALGDVKFLFPNDYAIYFHDTPSKNLFHRASRAFSHGCVRIHNPFEFGDVIMKHAKGWNDGRLAGMLGNRERWIKLKSDIRVHLTYFTAEADGAGKVSYKSDVYGHMSKLKTALGLI